jgi:hypothetical protein
MRRSPEADDACASSVGSRCGSNLEKGTQRGQEGPITGLARNPEAARRRSRPVRLSMVVALLVAAGCLDAGGTEPEEPEQDAEQGLHLDLKQFPAPLDHDHADAGLHDLFQGVERLSHLSTDDGGPQGPQGAYNLAIGTDLLVASLAPIVGGALAPGLTLYVMDISQPERPVGLYRFGVLGGGVEAVAITPDDRFAFLGAEFSGAVGIWTIDLADPANPRPAGFTPLLLEGPHNVRYTEVDGQPLVLASVSHVSTAPTAAGLPQDSNPVHDLRVDILAFDPDAPGLPMELVSSYAAPGTAGLPSGTPIVHDAVAQRHPITNQTIMYVAHWDEGVRLVDISDPADPVELGAYTDPAPTSFLTIHTVKPHPTLIDGRHITVATAQCAYTPDAPCHVRILDTTDPTRPTQVGTWTLPEEVHGNVYTTEIFDLADGYLVQPWGHAGLWVLDLACAGCLVEPRIAGYDFFGHVESDVAGNSPFANAAIIRDGLAYVANVPTGIHVVGLPSRGPAS